MNDVEVLYLIEEDKERKRWVLGDKSEVEKHINWASGSLEPPEIIEVWSGLRFRPKKGGCLSYRGDGKLMIWGTFEADEDGHLPPWIGKKGEA